MAIPALVALVGGVLAALWHPTHRARSLIQHFAAGVVLAALAVELLPEIEREHAPGLVLAGAFAAGSLFMFGLKLWTSRVEHAAARGWRIVVVSGALGATVLLCALGGSHLLAGASPALLGGVLAASAAALL